MSELLGARVGFRKQVSDGNYGTEAAEVSFDVLSGLEAQGLERARNLVHAELMRSPSANVRRAVEPLVNPKPDVNDLEDLPF